MLSIALMPVCSRTLTLLRSVMQRRAFNRTEYGWFCFALSIDALTQRVDDAANRSSPTGTETTRPCDERYCPRADRRRCQNNNGNGVLFQVERHAVFAVFKLDQLVCHAAFKAAGAAIVADQNDRTGFVLFELLVVL